MIFDKTRSYFLAVALALMGGALAHQEWLIFQREARLESGGVITQGVLRGVRANKYESIALVEYAVPGEGLRVREVPVSRPFVHEIKAGGKTLDVKVRYLPQDYNVVDIPNATQVSGWGIFVVLVFFALSVWAFRRRGALG